MSSAPHPPAEVPPADGLFVKSGPGGSSGPVAQVEEGRLLGRVEGGGGCRLEETRWCHTLSPEV